MNTSSIENFQNVLRDFKVAMLVTRTDRGEMRGRPMALADVGTDGNIVLVTGRNSAKVDEIAQDPHVNVTMQSSMKFISISGTASINDDRAKIHQLWQESWRIWFPGGKDDPEIVLLQIDGSVGEYWDYSGTVGINYLIEAGRAYFSGQQFDSSNRRLHDKVSM